MAIDTITRRIAALEAFQGLSDDAIAEVAQVSDRMIFRDGQKIATAGEDNDGAVLIIDGRAGLQADPERGVEASELEPGTMIGETGMLTEHHLAITVVATGDVKAVKISREAMHELIATNAELRDHFQRRLAARLSRVVLELQLIDQRLLMAASEIPRLEAPPDAPKEAESA